MDQIKQPMLDANVHRRVLGFLNAARRPEDLMVPPRTEVALIDGRVMHGNEDAEEHREGTPKAPRLLARELAKCVLEARERISPLYGFQHIHQLEKVRGFETRAPDCPRASPGWWRSPSLEDRCTRGRGFPSG